MCCAVLASRPTSMRLLRAISLSVGIALGWTAHAQTFINSVPITIVDNGAASTYPSTIQVSGVVGTVQHVGVRFNGFRHTYPSDVAMLLVAPSGQAVILMSRCGGVVPVNNMTFSFSDSASDTIPGPMVAGSYRPSVCQDAMLPAPAPAGPFSQDLGDFQGTDVNGTWKLYVCDLAPQDTGAIGSWSISFDTHTPVPTETAFTYQGVMTDNGAPISGDVTARFQLFGEETGGVRVGPPLLKTVSVNNGLLTTWLDFGATPLSASSARWLEVTIDGQVQSPRQRLMNAPAASKALVAESVPVVPWSTVAGVPANVSDAFSPWTAATGGITYLNAVGIGTPTFTSKFNIASTDGNTSYQTSASQYGTYAIMHNDTAGNYWQFIATGTGNSGGANDLVIANSIVPGTASSNAVRLTSGNYMGIGLPVGTLPSQRLTVNGNVLANNVAVPSSIRFKDHVVPMDDALSKLLKLEGVRFDWKPEWAKERPGREHDIGFVAEDVAKVFPEVVFYDADGNVTGMDYSRMTAVAIEAIKQQQTQMDAQRASFTEELAKRDAENAELRLRLERLERAISERR